MYVVIKAYVKEARIAEDRKLLNSGSQVGVVKPSSSEILFKEINGEVIAYYKPEFEIEKKEDTFFKKNRDET